MNLTSKQQQRKAENFATAMAGIIFLFIFLYAFFVSSVA